MTGRVRSERPRLRKIDVVTSARSSTLGPDSRPVFIPEDVDDPSVLKAAGLIELPVHVRWSGPPKRYDLSNPVDRALVYEQVLSEGTADDVRYYIDVDTLLSIWDYLVLPKRVRRAWSAWFRRLRNVEVAC